MMVPQAVVQLAWHLCPCWEAEPHSAPPCPLSSRSPPPWPATRAEAGGPVEVWLGAVGGAEWCSLLAPAHRCCCCCLPSGFALWLPALQSTNSRPCRSPSPPLSSLRMQLKHRDLSGREVASQYYEGGSDQEGDEDDEDEDEEGQEEEQEEEYEGESQPADDY